MNVNAKLVANTQAPINITYTPWHTANKKLNKRFVSYLLLLLYEWLVYFRMHAYARSYGIIQYTHAHTYVHS